MSKQLRIAPVLAIAMALVMLISACGGSTDNGGGSSSTTTGTPGAYNCVSDSISISGSTALFPLVKAVSDKYKAKCSGASFTITPNGSGTGLNQVESSAVKIGMSDVFKKSGQDDLVDHKVAVVIFSLILNSKVTGVTSLTTAQIKDIYSGKTTNWKEVGGANLNIVVVSRPSNSGTRQTFQNFILGGPETVSGPSNLTTDSTGTVVKNVQQTDGAIGYVAFNAAKKSGLTILQIDGTAPSADGVKSNTYKFWNFEHMYTKGAGSGLSQALIDYMASADGKQEAASLDFVPIADMSADAVTSHQPK
ncbi:MAG: phosphate ABC transporter substrate-binding protein PstS family protein [Ktedonobacteraceae bacterium]